MVAPPQRSNQQEQLRTRVECRLLSIVIPVYNEEDVIPYLRENLERWLTTLRCPREIILVDDGSHDRSWSLLAEWAAADKTVKLLSLSKNFGHQAAVTAGLDAANGDAIVITDADLQDPLETIDAMLAKYLEGYDIIYAQREKRLGETRFKRFTAWLFYRLMKTLVHRDLPADTGDFRMVSRRALDAMLRMRETQRFLRGMFAWIGFHQTAVRYVRQPRKHGVSKYPLSKMLRFALDAALSFSTIPMKLMSIAGFLIALFGLVYGGYAVLRWLVWHDTVQGWATLIVLLALIGGMILIGLGVVGEYVGRVYEEVKCRPIYVIRDRVNFDG
ncbi:MAG: glycosyltransferase family 2 protein [Planctomycetota bacterium]